MAAITTQRNGNWSDTVAETTPWTGGVAPTTGDTTTISHTVTIDDSAPTTITVGTDTTTAAINIASGGTLQYLYTATVDHVLELRGDLIVASGGTIAIGISSNAIPSTRKFTFELNKDGVDGDYGFICQAGSTCNLYGASKTDRCLVNSDITVGDNHFHSDTSTSWKSGDNIAFAPTSRTYTQHESFTLDADASGTTINLPSGSTFAYAHSGTTPTQGEVINLTRNIIVTSDTTTAVGYFNCATSTIVNCYNVEFSYLGTDVSLKRGFDISTTTGSTNVDGCSFHHFESSAIYTGTNHNNWTITNCVFYSNSLVANMANIQIVSTTGTSWELSHIILIYSGDVGTSNRGMYIADIEGNAHSITVVGTRAAGIYLIQAAAAPSTWANFTSHSNNGIGIDLNSFAKFDITGMTIWRNNSYGLVLNTSSVRCGILRDVTIFGNFSSIGQNISVGGGCNIIFYNLTSDSDTTYATRSAITIGANCHLYIYNSNISQGSSPKTAHTNFFEMPGVYTPEVNIYNTANGSTNLFDSQTYMSTYGYVSFHNFNNVANRYRTCKDFGDISDVVTGGQTSAWCRDASGDCIYLNPTSTTAGQTLNWEFYTPCTSGDSFSVSCYVKKTQYVNGPSMTLDIYDASDDTTYLASGDSVTFGASGDGWTSWSSSSCTPSRTGFCRCIFKALNGSNTGDIGIEDVDII